MHMCSWGADNIYHFVGGRYAIIVQLQQVSA
jgi:hypothetical protein